MTTCTSLKCSMANFTAHFPIITAFLFLKHLKFTIYYYEYILNIAILKVLGVITSENC